MEENGAATARESQAAPERRPKTSRKPAAQGASEAEQIKMGTVEIEVPAALLKTAQDFRSVCGSGRADDAEEIAKGMAQQAYVDALTPLIAGDEYWLKHLTKKAAKAK